MGAELIDTLEVVTEKKQPISGGIGNMNFVVDQLVFVFNDVGKLIDLVQLFFPVHIIWATSVQNAVIGDGYLSSFLKELKEVVVVVVNSVRHASVITGMCFVASSR